MTHFEWLIVIILSDFLTILKNREMCDGAMHSIDCSRAMDYFFIFKVYVIDPNHSKIIYN
jgi:hypothetical protein